MKADIILYVGLPGSGKTYLAKEECDIVIDDIANIAQLPSIEMMKTIRKLGICDVNFCNSKTLKAAISILESRYQDHWVFVKYFENDVDKCRKNVIYRNDGRNVEGTIYRFSKEYAPPEDAITIWNLKENLL